MHHNVIEIFLFLTVVIVTAKGAGWLSTKIGQPAVLGEILAGLLLGPTLLGVATLPLFPESRSQDNQHAEQQIALEQLINDYAASEEISYEEAEHVVLDELEKDVADYIEGAEITSGLSDEYRRRISDIATSEFHHAALEKKSFLEDFIKVLAEIGVLFLMFMAGIETDLATMKRVGKVALGAAAGGVIAPFILGFGVTVLMIPQFGIYTAIFTGTILCATSVSISAQTLKELGALNSKEGTTILGAAVIDDVLGIILLSLVIAFNPSSGGNGNAFPKMYETLTLWINSTTGLEGTPASVVGIVLLLISIVLFFVMFYAFGSMYFQKMLTWAERLPISEPRLAISIALGLLFAWAAEYIGAVAAITGTYLAGVLIGQTSHRHDIEHRLGILTYSFFVPIFFINIGLEANARQLGGDMLPFTIVICVVAILAKIVGSLVGAKATGFNFMESLRVGTGMVSRGEVGLIVASVGLSAGIIGQEEFSVMIVMVLVTTLVTPIMLRFVFPRKEPNRKE
ncbi:MAG TPA: cation:proton antiporter [bacterium]|jgi:Kef-type K+ transport system membrane component KefB